jgi:hypothetical protein
MGLAKPPFGLALDFPEPRYRTKAVFQHSFGALPCSMKIHDGVSSPEIREQDLVRLL